MKLSFAIPDELGRQFKKAVPAGQRSAVVTALLKKKLGVSEANLEKVCTRVNRLTRLDQEMSAWEKFDDSDA